MEYIDLLLHHLQAGGASWQESNQRFLVIRPIQTALYFRASIQLLPIAQFLSGLFTPARPAVAKVISKVGVAASSSPTDLYGTPTLAQSQ